MSFPWPSNARCGWAKTAAEKRESYGAQLKSSLPFTAIRSLSDVPAGAIEARIENAIAGKAKGVEKASVGGRALGRWGGSVAGVLTAPVFLGGLKDVQSKDPKERKRGVAKVLLAGSAGAALKGGVEGAAEYGLRGGTERALTRSTLGLPGAAGAVYTALHQSSRKNDSAGKKAGAGAAIGAVSGLGRGAAEAAFENRGLWRTNRSALAKKTLGRGVGKAAGGAVKGTLLALVLDKILARRDDK